MIPDVSRPVPDAGGSKGGAARYLVVVARTEPALYEHLRNRHGNDPAVRVVLDRRGARDVEAADGRPAVERRRRRSWLTSGATHELVALAREGAPQSNSLKPIVCHEEAGSQMSHIENFEDAQRLTRWLSESQDLLGRVVPALLEERERLRQTAEAKAHECERLQGEVAELQRTLGALQSDHETLRGERAAMADAFGGVVDLLSQLQRPLGEIARRLDAGRPASLTMSAS